MSAPESPSSIKEALALYTKFLKARSALENSNCRKLYYHILLYSGECHIIKYAMTTHNITLSVGISNVCDDPDNNAYLIELNKL